MTEKMFTIGKIINTHGIHGEVKVMRITDFEERFAVGETVYAVKEDGKQVELVITAHRIHKGYDLIFFKGFGTINEVEHLKGTQLKITEGQLTELGENEFYYHEIIGCDVYTVDGGVLGEIKEILSPGANDVWVVKQPGGKDILIPYISDVVIEIDVKAQNVVIEPMEGLLD
ncbi:ribosome maturation factor RimM [Virgibacillus sp. NKC19-3]|uniref:ribosome maturation factor RimM n=1 Tax=Virgibacillus saliphilus TaxID=2831674 RepID=UPI001C9A8631|nr:ribosome maturation factor RimM [Virgibacillus sp. NKC19-3]MBY7143656.1 ribosome maturation factor RimM [Virgibacillus sp. NKC19-3]